MSLLQSSDGVRWAPAAGFAPGPGSAPAPVRRGSTLYLYDSASVSGSALRGPLRRFSVGAGGRLTEREASFYEVRLASPEDAQRASAGTFPPSVALEDTGALVFVYALRFEPETNACPVAGRACLKIRTATETAGSDGAAFVGDPGNRFVLGFDPGHRGWTAVPPARLDRLGGALPGTRRVPARPDRRRPAQAVPERRLRHDRGAREPSGALGPAAARVPALRPRRRPGGSRRQRTAHADRSGAVPAAGARREPSFGGWSRTRPERRAGPARRSPGSPGQLIRKTPIRGSARPRVTDEHNRRHPDNHPRRHPRASTARPGARTF